MRTLTGLTMTAGILVLASLAAAQRPGGRGGPRDGDGPGPGSGSDDLVARMMAYDKDGDGKLARAEVGDRRLHRLFDRADADKDGTVTRAELTALAAKEAASDRGPRGFGGPGGPGGFGPPGFQGPPPPRPGEVLSPGLQQRLRLTDEQKAKLADLQKEVNARLETILDDDQRQQLKDIRERGPGGFGPPGGGRGRPGGDRPPPPRDDRP